MQTTTHRFEFHGKAGEYFKIWIVNIMLSIVTLGIYSAWAKVRTKRYFYSNTLLINTPFDYLADPVKILKGRLLAFVLILIYSFTGMLSPVLEGILLLLFMLLLPWIIIKALKFNLYNSAYRNIRFHFEAEYLHALMIFIGYPILIPFTLGLIYPAFVRARKKFVIDHSAYGSSSFSLSAEVKAFYIAYLKITGMAILIFTFIFLWFYLDQLLRLQLGIINPQQDLQTGNINPLFIIETLVHILVFSSVLIIYGYAYTSISNLVLNHTQLQQCCFESKLKTSTICQLYITNTLAIVFSFGLLIPWAKIRITRYRLSCLSLIIEGDANTFIAGEAEKTAALGEELDELLDLDIGL